MAIANLGRSRARVSFLSLVIAVGASIFLLSQAVASRVESVTQTQVLQHASFLRLDVSAPLTGVAPDLTDDVLASIAKTPDVAQVQPVIRELVGIDDSPVGIMASTLAPGDEPPIVSSSRPDVFPLAEGEIVVPSALDGSATTNQPGSSMTVHYTVRTGPASGELRNETLKVVALYDGAWQPQGPNVSYVAAATLRRWIEFRDALTPGQLGREVGYDAVVVIARDADSVPRAAAALRSEGYTVIDLQERLSQVPGVIKLVQIAGWILLGAVVLMTVVAASATIGAYIRQRRPEIGLLKAIGYRNRDVLGLLLGEAGLIGLLGATASIVIGCLLSLAATTVLVQQPDLAASLGGSPLLPSLEACLAVSGILIAAAIIGASVPAVQAARMEPAIALREP
jgi:putative ABC transport system permease protein